MKIEAQKILRHRYSIQGIVLFMLLCFVTECFLQHRAQTQWNEALNQALEHSGSVTMGAPDSYSYLSAFQVFPKRFMSYHSDIDTLSLLMEGMLFFILLCGWLSNVIQEKSVGIIRGFMGFIFLEKLFVILYFLWSVCSSSFLSFHHSGGGTFTFLPLFFDLLFLFLAGLVILYYKQTRVAEQEVYETNGVQTISLIPSSNGKRFINHLLDTVVFVLIIVKHVFIIAERSQLEETPWTLYLLILLSVFLYYFLSELWFSATPGKMFTSTRVIDQHGEHPGFFKILVRTLCRFIPFDRLSFFFNANWHDKLSETYVVGEV